LIELNFFCGFFLGVEFCRVSRAAVEAVDLLLGLHYIQEDSNFNWHLDISEH
jgi:hypothetical protein